MLKKTMSKSLLLVAFTNLSMVAFAQNPKAAQTAATTSYEFYKVDNNQKNELKKAKENIDIAAASDELSSNPKTWRYKGQIYTAIAFDNKLKADYPDAALTSYNAWVKSLELEEAKLAAKAKPGKAPSTKIPAKAEFKEGFEFAGRALYNSGIDQLQGTGGYAGAYPYYMGIVNIKTRASAIFGGKTPEYGFAEDDVNRLAGICAFMVGKVEEGEKLLRPLIDGGKIKQDILSEIYSKMADGYSKAGNKDKARAILNEGRTKFPSDKGLLIALINLAIEEGKLPEAEGQLKEAMALDPKNVELMFVTGNLYDELFRKKIDIKNPEPVTGDAETQGTDFYNKAVAMYQKGMETDAKHFASVYSLGAIHVNYSNHLAKKINKMELKNPNYKTAKAEYEALLEKALGFLLTAEKLQPNDLGTLIALQEVYTRKNDSDNFMKYKKRIEEVRAASKGK